MEKKKYKCLICKKEFEPSDYILRKLKGLDVDYLNNLDSSKIYEHPVPLCCSSCRVTYQNRKIGSPFKRKEVREKAKQTNIERTGYPNPWCKNAPGRKTYEKTMIEKYGYHNCWCKGSPAREKAIKTFRERYGCSSNFARKDVVEKTKQTVKNLKEKDPNWIKEVQEKYRKTMIEKYGLSNSLFFHAGKMISQINKSFGEKLKQINLEIEYEKYVNNYFYDIHILNSNILIEINPWYTHNSTYGTHWSEKTLKEKDYHYNKTNSAIREHYRVINIWDWDDINKIVDYLKPQQSIYARKCDIKQIDKKLAKQFLNQYHLQGCTQTCQYAYGLFYNDELFQVMTFGKPRYNKKYDYELLRLCTKSGFKIVGGASKLLTHFERDVKPKSLISYCDLSKFNGDIYEKLGFKYIRTSIMKHWYNMKTNVHITDNLLRQRGFDQLHGTNYGKGTSNEELMLEYDYVEVYDAGQSTYIKTYEKG